MDQARALPADLLVMGTHGRSGLGRLVLGSVTEDVLRKATCPVLSVPRGVPDAVPAPPVLFERILCAVDFSACSLRALHYAMSLAQQAGARLAVLSVLERPFEVGHRLGGKEPDVEACRSAYEEECRQRLDDVIPVALRAYCPVEIVVTAGTPYHEILQTAAAQQSELIVIGVHGRSAADLMFFGSTAHQVVRAATCPVLTLRTG